jgi:hypothetical protein
MLAPECARHRQELIVLVKIADQDGKRPHELATLLLDVVAEQRTQMRSCLEETMIKAISGLASDRPDTIE